MAKFVVKVTNIERSDQLLINVLLRLRKLTLGTLMYKRTTANFKAEIKGQNSAGRLFQFALTEVAFA